MRPGPPGATGPLSALARPAQDPLGMRRAARGPPGATALLLSTAARRRESPPRARPRGRGRPGPDFLLPRRRHPGGRKARRGAPPPLAGGRAGSRGASPEHGAGEVRGGPRRRPRQRGEPAAPPPGFRPRTDGCFELLGAPVGSDAFYRECAQQRVDKATELLDALGALENAQVALHLLRQCAGFCRLKYSARIVPPSVQTEAPATLDKAVRASLEQLSGSSHGRLLGAGAARPQGRRPGATLRGAPRARRLLGLPRGLLRALQTALAGLLRRRHWRRRRPGRCHDGLQRPPTAGGQDRPPAARRPPA